MDLLFNNFKFILCEKILESALTSMPPAQLYKVSLPKFTLRMNKELNQPLESLGLNIVFDPARANFSGMVRDTAGPTLSVNEIIHEAMIEVRQMCV